ncbi:ATP synthase F1 subunit gamma [Candidatus Kaiserbacteria bacterium RIFCSPLOWO2_01_FULL_59_34]|uniref:ATP synthase gamma chain n=2 Tax=Candidatus Kaiseribacteriota TaxID=1752734 RepID=A0A0G2BPF2_9BACT|nr:MAG: ATP synthase F1 subcomplex gamma subunit [Candidatus Kaiserbacteria bacterium GW2011_GWA2_58_9]OGG62151.1 MAG: ATP synthase F1 subunit gamma [Candidatus Kaiserbacteria bacterium RIFCSPHIGHO2_01_FULL_58_22]OGG78907.1 MAG: ATP synthase F1 subunit gamma [Candidatus Kaiserbacteria bacterium RIFCSPLOWO2_01_FULL_59_34]OGG85946.1 MAG: ATP synthase F1 subunit gamma [Candidatus Kaiserbacteria bacterium RIFCSPLOWO2_02_FULL_59_19]
MASLKSIKTKIVSYKKTGTVTHAMEAVSAVKMRKSQERALNGRAYAAAALSVLERLAGTPDAERHPLAKEQIGKTCIIVITSDKGLAGSLNSAVVRSVEAEIARRRLAKNDVVMIAVGRRGGDYFASRGYEVRVKHENVSDGVSEGETRMITDKLLEWKEAGEVGECVIAYQNFLSTFEQEAGVRQIVPITAEMMREMVQHIRPAKGKYAPETGEKHEQPAVYTIEPSPEEVLSALLPKLLNIAVFHALLEAKASEHSARMVAMKNATDKAKEMAGDLTRTFNKVRQAAITREVSEITSGIEAMR